MHTMEYARYLAESIGPRPAGSEKEREAAEYICTCFRNLGLEPVIQPFTFLNWIPHEQPYLEILEPVTGSMPLALMNYTMSSGAAGITGTITKCKGKMVLVPKYKEWEKYSVQDETGCEIGYILKNPDGQASPFPTSRLKLQQVGAIIGRSDAERIDAWLEEGKVVRVRLHSDCEMCLGQSRNVIAKVGTGDPEIVITAHFDSVYFAPGAVDNGSGIQVMLRLAEEFRDRTGTTIAFVACGAEEDDLLGSYHYVYNLQEQGGMGRLRACVNFDMLANGEWLMLRSGSGFEDKVTAAVEAVRDRLKHPVKQEYAKPVSDNWPFETAGIPNVQVGAQPFSLYHLPADTMEVYDLSLEEDAVTIARQLIDSLCEGTK